MKKLDSKFLITCAVIISLPIIFILFMMLLRGCSSGKKTYTKYEKMMVTKAKSYAKNHKMLPSSGKSTILKLDNLVDGGLKSPNKALKDDSCSGSVVIKNNSKDNKDYYNYIPYLECDNYKTKKSEMFHEIFILRMFTEYAGTLKFTLFVPVALTVVVSG